MHAHNLVWIDLEMTGLTVQTDVILEIACVITDGNLKVVAKHPSVVIHQPEEKLVSMEAWSREHHTKSGLVDQVRNSTITVHAAEEQILSFIKQHCTPQTGLLAGNSVWQDRTFLLAYMPRIVQYLHYRLIDVTSIKEVVKNWYPDNPNVYFKKKDMHRALEDVYESIAELNHYRTNFFV
jgi:oligoribonuclease